MKLFGKNQNDDNVEKALIFYYAKYMGVLARSYNRRGILQMKNNLVNRM